jgi:hypothetical protein
MTDRETLFAAAESDPIGTLALLVEACERGETNLRPYLDAGHRAIVYAQDHLLVLVPESAIQGDVTPEMGKPSPHKLYAQAGGDVEKYRALMIEHGYLIRKEKS